MHEDARSKLLSRVRSECSILLAKDIVLTVLHEGDIY